MEQELKDKTLAYLKGRLVTDQDKVTRRETWEAVASNMSEEDFKLALSQEFKGNGFPGFKSTVGRFGGIVRDVTIVEMGEQTAKVASGESEMPAKKASPPQTTATADVAPAKAKVAPAPVKAQTMKADLEAAKRLQMARAAILKATGKKDVQINRSAMPAVSTGSFLVDHIIGGCLSEDGKGALCPGYPRRYITEIYGKEASGKTTAALEAVAEVQRQPGGSAMFLDFEHALNQRYARSVGVNFDPEKLLFFQPDTMEEGWKMILVGLKVGVDIIVVDSVSAMVPQAELDKDLSAEAKIGAQASNLSRNLPKLVGWLHNPKVSANPKGTAVILVNQTRALISKTAKGDVENTSGGNALKFYMYLRLRFTKIRGEFIKRKNRLTGKEQSFQYGNHTQVKVIKNKIDGTAGHTTDIFIRYGQGIDDYYSLMESAHNLKIISRSGGTNKYGSYVAPSKEKFRELLVQNPSLYEEIKTQVLASLRDPNLSPEIGDDDELGDIVGLLEGSLSEEDSEEGDSTDVEVEVSDAEVDLGD